MKSIMKRSTSVQRLEIIRLCHSGLDSRTLRIELLKLLRRVIPFDYIFFSTTDPTTMLFTSSVFDDSPNWALLQFLENELLQDDFNKFLYLFSNHLPVGVLSEQTQSDLSRSQRYRDILNPMALGDEMRAVFVANGACWGTVCLHRERATTEYTPDEAAFLAQLTPHIAEGLRKSLLLESSTPAKAPDGPGVLILSEDLSVTATTPAADYWLAELTEAERGNRHALPHIILTVVRRLQGIERGILTDPASMPKVPVLAPSGQWLMLYASRLRNPNSQGQITVIFEMAQPLEIAPLIMQAYNLTKREGEVTQCILRGWSTTEISTALSISSNTVQDHLKAIFEKVGVRSRRELAGHIFAQQYQSHFIEGAPMDAAGRLVSSKPLPA
ncbi:MAG: LuxR family transcriptional regulator [Ktedonobacteraceae bacterium]|nr:LuxR family transcriptional regulator [Ktedonobacteraceae bacterium]